MKREQFSPEAQKKIDAEIRRQERREASGAAPIRGCQGASRKYKNRKVDTPEGQFDSIGEYRVFQTLQLLEKTGAISQLVHHPAFKFHGLKGRYTPDYMYVENGKLVVEDFKSEPTRKTEAWRRTKQLWAKCYPNIELRETQK